MTSMYVGGFFPDRIYINSEAENDGLREIAFNGS